MFLVIRVLTKEVGIFNVFHKLYTTTWKNKSGNNIIEERLDRGQLKFILEMLTCADESGPKRKCLEEH